MRTLTKEESEELGLGYYPGAQYCLLDTKKNSIFLSSDTLEGCTDALRRMTPEHPKYKDMELVKTP